MSPILGLLPGDQNNISIVNNNYRVSLENKY